MDGIEVVAVLDGRLEAVSSLSSMSAAVWERSLSDARHHVEDNNSHRK